MNFTEIGCRAHGDCVSQKACINGVCADPCTSSSPCLDNQECQVLDHQPVCIKGNDIYLKYFNYFFKNVISVCQCQKQSDCKSNAVCNGCDCIERKNIYLH